ncbi:hypothetical protein [Hydrogenophaga sp. R2]|uniref:hypothetical protein n=1 Tax=Hydrogenophaga sp. R2 TaxID=3132827 RepID=UPI003CE6D67B
MIYFKHPSSAEVFAYETEQERNDFGAPELVQMTAAEVESHINQQQSNQGPRVVTMRQARRALLEAGLLQQVDLAIDALPEPQRSAVRIDWEYSSEVHRDRAFVQQLGQALGLSDEQLDALFIQAAAL